MGRLDGGLASRAKMLAPMVLLLACSPQAPEAARAAASGSFEGSGVYFTPAEMVERSQGELVYLSTYSHLTLFGNRRWDLSTNLSIRNIDPDEPVIVELVEYYDSAGALVEAYLDEPHALAPMASTTLTLPQQDQRGGAGANFLIRWSAGAAANRPLIEAVMAGVSGNQSFSFLTQGVVISE